MKLGMAMRPLKVSATSQTVSREATEPRTTTTMKAPWKIFVALRPKRNWVQRVPYRDQPRMVEKAKSIRAKATKREAKRAPKTVAKACMMSSLPGFTPKGISTPLQMMVRAVREQMTMVSTKTSKMPKTPCSTGPLVSAAAWAMAAEPRPASLEKALRRIPQMTVCFSRMPEPAPRTAWGVKALAKISWKAFPMFPAWAAMTMRVKRM